jgi:hypothetical protein
MNNKKTAFLVIAGTGRQRPLDALDCFARGLVAAIRERADSDADIPLTLSNRLPIRTGYAGCLRIEPDGSRPIDLYEYYWGDRSPGSAGLDEIIGWLIDVSAGAKRFYEAHPEAADDLDLPVRKAMRNGIMATNWYLVRLGGLFRAVALIDQVFPADYWIRLSHLLKAAVLPILGFVHKQTADLLQESAGELVAYTRRDTRNACCTPRDAILDGIIARLQLILESPEDYDQVVIATHSLGSVIAYDALNRLVHQLNTLSGTQPSDGYRRLSGLVTFGSPLDKVAFLFRFHPANDGYIRRQLIGQRYRLRSKDAYSVDGHGGELQLANPYTIKLDHQIRWINYWDARDPMGGHLDFYRVDENVECEMHGGQPEAHREYWNYLPMYQDIARRFLGIRSSG